MEQLKLDTLTQIENLRNLVDWGKMYPAKSMSVGDKFFFYTFFECTGTVGEEKIIPLETIVERLSQKKHIYFFMQCRIGEITEKICRDDQYEFRAENVLGWTTYLERTVKKENRRETRTAPDNTPWEVYSEYGNKVPAYSLDSVLYAFAQCETLLEQDVKLVLLRLTRVLGLSEEKENDIFQLIVRLNKTLKVSA